jgi:ABC-type transporter MlaC component
MLERHIKNRRPQKYAEKVAEHVLQTLQPEVSQSSSSKSKSSDSMKALSSYLIPYPGFEGALLKWMIKNYQPLSVIECKDFQEMCQTLNTKAPLVGHDQVARLLFMEYHVV